MLPWLAAGLLLCTPSGPLAAQAEAQPADMSALYAEARAARERRDHKGAIEKLARLVAAKPDSSESWWLLAWLYDSQGKQKDALAAFRQAATRLPESDERRAEAQRRVAKLAKALEGRAKPRPYVPPQARWTWYLPSGWSLGLLGLLLAVCAQGWRRAWREDRRRGPGGPAARRARLAERLRAADPTALPELLRRAEAGELDVDEQLMLAAATQRRGTPPHQLAELLTKTAPATIAAPAAIAAQALPDTPDDLVTLALDAHDDRAVAAARALAKRPASEALWAKVATAAPQPGARDAVFEALLAADSLPADLAGPLGRRLADTSAPDRPRLALALARTGPKGAVTLVRATVDADAEVRAAAGDELRLRPVLKPLPEAALRLIAQAAAGKRPRMSAEFLAVAAETGPELARPLLRHAIDSRHWPQRHAAVELSPLLPAEEAVTLLRRALERLPHRLPEGGPEAEHWRRLCGTLSERPLPDLLPEFLALAAHRPDDTEALVVARLLASGDGAREALARAGEHASPEVRRLAAELGVQP
ncbi:MAG: hypothetical protein HZB16_00945 [Armatimonadetes bacterium]|nr:hypothetical protein [Armatimonadota bacterium]